MSARPRTGASRMARTGLEVLCARGAGSLRGRRVALLAHPASVSADLAHAVDLLRGLQGLSLVALFGPQHGIRGEKQDNMVESESCVDPATGLPVHSLYGDVRQPTAAMLSGLDVLLVDLQDVGVRVYTFAWTMVLAMEACARAGVAVVVLDRPNPIGGVEREGTMLRPGFESFVGFHSLPLRHGLTLGEIARLAAAERGLDVDLEVIDGEWRRADWLDEMGLPFVMPSPNLPTIESCAVFPGTVLLEGTTLSEGRGTTRPFELVGAPWLRPDDLARELASFDLPGVKFRPVVFEPTFQKHAGRACGGVQIHVMDRRAFRPVRTAVAIVAASRRLAPRGTEIWRQPPYEYETVRMPIDLLWGSDDLRLRIEAGEGPHEVMAAEAEDLRDFDLRIGAHVLR